MKDSIRNSKLCLQMTIKHITTIIQSSPGEMTRQLDRTLFTDPTEADLYQRPMDARFINTKLGRVLECLLEARNSLIELGFYDFGVINEKEKTDIYSQESTSRIHAGEGLLNSVDENDWGPDCDTA